MKILHVGIWQDDEVGEVILEKGLLLNGHEVSRFDYRGLASKFGVEGMNNMIIDQATKMNCEMVFIGKGELVNRKTLHKLRKKGIIVTLWYGDYRKPPNNWLIDNLHETDFFFSTSGGSTLQSYFEKGSPGVASFFIVPSDPELSMKWRFYPRGTKDVVFTGSNHNLGGFGIGGLERNQTIDYLTTRDDVEFWGYYKSTNNYKNQLMRFLERLTQSRFHSKWISGDEYIRAIISAKIGVGVSLVQNIQKYSSVRLQHYLMFGTFYLAWHFPQIEELFNVGRELVCFHNVKELEDNIDYYLVNDKERETIAKNGQSAMIYRYNTKNIMGMILDVIEKGSSQRFPWIEILSNK